MKFGLRAGLCAAGALALVACFPASENEAANETSIEASPLLYEIINADGEVEGWMLGTIHALPDGTKWRTPEIEQVVSQADYLIVEIADLTNIAGSAQVFSRLATTSGLPDLTDRTEPELWPVLFDLTRRAELSTDQFSSIETWAAALMLAQVDAGGDPANGVDRAMIRAFENRKIREFEGVAEQLAIFDALPEQDQRDLLAGVLRETARLRDDPDRLPNAWLSGDLEVLEDIASTGIMADPELREALLVGRNEDWTEQLVGELDDPPKPLVAVGAAHLVGQDGLPALLEARGYEVRSLH